jgi:hypothetical protein
MAGLRRLAVSIVAALLLVVALAVPVLGQHGGGAQLLPAASCNAGTMNAHESLGANAMAHERIPADDHGPGCHHLNPTVGH